MEHRPSAAVDAGHASVAGTHEEPLLLVEQLIVEGAAARVASVHAGDEHALVACVRTMLDFAGTAMEHGGQLAMLDAVDARVAQLTDRIERATTGDIPAAVSKLSETLAAEMAKVVGDGDRGGELQAHMNALISARLAEAVAGLVGEHGPLGIMRAELKVTAQEIAQTQRQQLTQVAQLLERYEAERELRQQQLAGMAELAAVASKGTHKGAVYEETINALLHATCAPYEGEIESTHTTGGLIPGCKKGDWVVSFTDASAPRPVRVVIETKDSRQSAPAVRRELDEAMQNRDADAALMVLAGPELAPGGVRLSMHVQTRQVLVVQGRDDDDSLLLDIGIQLTRAIALQHALLQAGTATDLDLGELSRLVNAIVEAIDQARSTTTHTRAARKALDRIDGVYADLETHARAACNELTQRLRGE